MYVVYICCYVPVAPTPYSVGRKQEEDVAKLNERIWPASVVLFRRRKTLRKEAKGGKQIKRKTLASMNCVTLHLRITQKPTVAAVGTMQCHAGAVSICTDAIEMFLIAMQARNMTSCFQELWQNDSILRQPDRRTAFSKFSARHSGLISTSHYTI